MLVDSNLPVERDRLKNRLIRLVKEDQDILGCFFSGSIGSQTEDFYSSIDTGIIVRNGVDIKRKQIEIIRAIGRYLVIERINDHFSIINYASFIQLDLHVYNKQQLKPGRWLKDILIIKDFGLIKELSNQSQQIAYHITQEEFNQLIFNYYNTYFDLYRCWRKKEGNYMEALALSMKHTLISMWYIKKGFKPNAAHEWGNYEGRNSKLSHFELNFIQSFTPLTFTNIESFTKKMELLIFESAEKIATYNHLNFSVDTFKKVHKRISFNSEKSTTNE